jgi:hypothetical protein
MSEMPDQDPDPSYLSAGFTKPPRKNWAPWIFAATAVLVVAVVVVIAVSLSGDDDNDPDSPTGVANAVIDALNAQDENSMRPVMCEARIPNVLKHIEAQSSEVETHASLKGFATVTDDSATALVILNVSYQGTSNDLDFELYLDKRGSTWCAEQFAGPAEYTRG